MAVVHGVVHEDDECADEARGGFEPGRGIGGHVADEDVDVEGFLQGEFVDADIGVPFAVGAGGAVFEGWRDGDGGSRVAVSLAFVDGDAAGGELVVWVVELLDCGAGVGTQLVGGHPPIADFGVGVAERAGGADVGRGIQRSAGVGVEGGKARVDVFAGPWGDGEGAGRVGLGADVGAWVEGLEDGEESVDVGVVEEEDRVKGAVGN